ncbi:MAG TPA: PAS domain-containing protein, partial [Rhodocyclaceae bacterium]
MADLSREALVTTDLQFRVVSWPAAAEALLGWPRARAVGFGLGSVLSLSSSTMNGVREALDRSSQLKDALLPARRLGGVRCPLRANAQIVRNVGSEESLGIAFALSPMEEEGDISQEPPPAWLGRLMDCINLPVAVADVVGTLRYANFAARAQFGLEPGRPCCVGMCAEAGTGCRSARVLNSLSPSYWEAHSNGRRIDMTASPVTLTGSGPPDHVLYLGVPAQPHLSPELRKFFRAVDENLA